MKGQFPDRNDRIKDEGMELLGDFGRLLIGWFINRLSGPYEAELTPRYEIMRKHWQGFRIGQFAISRGKSFHHLLMCAQSGSGKSVMCAVPSVLGLAGKGSLVILDPAKEIGLATMGMLAGLRYRIVVIDFSDRSCERTDGWNPFPQTAAEFPAFIQALVDLRGSGGSQNQFFDIQGGGLLATLGKTLYRLPKERRNPAALIDLLSLLSAKGDLVDAFMAKHAVPEDWIMYLAHQKNSPNTKSSVEATAQSLIRVFEESHIRRMTANPTIDFSQLRKSPHAVFIQVNAGEIFTYRGLITLFSNQLISKLLIELPVPADLDLYLIMDEVGIFPINLELLTTQARKFRIALAALCQSEAQLFGLHGRERATTIIKNCHTRVYLDKPMDTAREIEQLAGRIEVEDKQGIKRVQSVLPADVAHNLPPERAVVVQGHRRPAVVRLRPYFKVPWMKRLTGIKAPEIECKIPPGNVPLFPIEKFTGPAKD